MELKSKSIKLFCTVVKLVLCCLLQIKLHLSVSAASRVITQLEDRVGFALFDRSTKSLTLTADGKDFYRVAMESIACLENSLGIFQLIANP